MTKHRKPEEWMEEILDAASEEMDAKGYSNLTMEAIAARTDLSKGGVYRFFANKREVARALFARLYDRLLDFDLEEALGWKLTLPETIFKVLFARFEEETSERNQRLWIQLVPETVWDESFRRERERMLDLLLEKYANLIRRVVKRDRLLLPLPDDFEEKLGTVLSFGVALIEGLAIQAPAGASREKRGALLSSFIDLMTEHFIEGK